MREREREPRAGAQHALHLAQHAPEVGERREGSLGERDVDRVAAEEREVGEVAGAQLDADLGGLGALAGREPGLGARVDRDDVGATPGELHRAGAVAAAELEDALALDVAEQSCEYEVLRHARAP